MDQEDIIADLLNSITQANLSSASSPPQWRDVISEYFCQLDSDVSDSEDEPSHTTDSTSVGEDDEQSILTVDPAQRYELCNEFVITDEQAKELEKVTKHKWVEICCQFCEFGDG